MNYCRACKHYKTILIGNYVAAHVCTRRPPQYDVVTADPVSERRDCKHERSDGWLMSRLGNTCGREGRFFQPKDTTNDTP